MLTAKAKIMLYELCEQYKNKRSHKISKERAKVLGSARFIQARYFPTWSLPDIEKSMQELGCAGYLENFCADNTVYLSRLSELAVCKFKNPEQPA